MILRTRLFMALALATGTAGAQPVYAERFAAQCAACHGARGQSTMALVPHLGGQHAFYTVTQLFLFRDGRRNDHPLAAAMTELAKGMSDDDLRGYSQYIATLPVPQPIDAGPRDEAKAARGRKLSEQHRCTACHGSDLAGGAQVPRIGHQREDYLAIALKGFRTGARVGYTPAMSEALAGLSEADLADLLHHLARPAR